MINSKYIAIPAAALLVGLAASAIAAPAKRPRSVGPRSITSKGSTRATPPS